MTFLSPVLLTLAAPILQDHSPLHPADASLFMQVPNIPALVEAYQQSAYGQLLGDMNLRGAIARVMGQEEFDPIGLFMEQWEAAEQSGEIPEIRPLLASIRGISFSVSLADHNLSAFVETANSLSGQEQEAAVTAMIGMDFVLELSEESFADQALGMMMEGLGPDAEKLQVTTIESPTGTLTQWVVEGTKGIEATLRILKSGPRLMLHIGDQGLATAQARATGTGLSVKERMGELGASLPEYEGTAVFELHNQIGDQVLDLIDSETGEVGIIGMAVQLLEAAGGPGFTMMLRNGAWRSSAANGRFTTNGVHLARDESVLDSAIGAANLTREGLSLVHPEAIAGGLVSIDADKLTSWLTEALAGEGEEQLAEIAETYGFHPVADFIEPLGSAGAWSLKNSIGLGAPLFQLMVAVRDPESMRRGLAGLARMLASAWEGQAAVKSRAYRGYDLHTVKFNTDGMNTGDLPFNPLDLFQPTFVVLDDRLLVTIDSVQAKSEIRRIIKGESLLHPALSVDLFPEGGAGQVGFANWIDVVGRLYSAAKSMAPMFAGGMGGEMPFDLTALPDAELFTRHFKTSYEWRRREGALVHYFGESSFGPEANGLAIVPFIGLGLATLTLGRPERAEEGVVTTSMDIQQSGAAAEEIALLQAAVSQFQTNNDGELPGGLELLFAADVNGASYASKDCQQDPWGNPYLYWEADGGREFAVWSAGPNGLDESGDGDDVTVSE